jgi:uncharacterized membrane-anchored protein
MLLWSYENGAMKRAKSVLAFLVLGACAALLCQPVSAADSPVPTPTQSNEWITGPARAGLGTVASIQVKPGYRFADANHARALLERSGNPVPQKLLGMLEPASGAWWMVLEFSEVGYVKTDVAEKLNAAEILTALDGQVQRQNTERKSRSLQTFTSLIWETPESVPHYDPGARSLEWAVRKQGPTPPLTSQALRLLGRRGTIDAKLTKFYRGFSVLEPLKDLGRAIRFEAGEGYAEYHQGDKVCPSGLASLVTDTVTIMKAPVAGDQAATVVAAPKGWRNWLQIGLAGAVVVCVVIGGALVLKSRRPRSSEPADRPVVVAAEPAAVSAPPPSVQPSPSVNGSEAMAVGGPSKPGLTAGRPRPLAFKDRVPGASTNTNGKQHGQQRKKVFDYNRYFTDLMTAVSSHTSQVDQPQAGTSAFDTARPEPGSAEAEPEPQNLGAASGLQAELIASQRLLIEEQLRLIQEQSKIIEEKAKLIADRNKLLQMQSELLGDKLM